MFTELNDAFKQSDNCTVCQWQYTSMCPVNGGYIGRQLSDVTQTINVNKMCHRFVVSPLEQQKRWQLTMDKMHQNIF